MPSKKVSPMPPMTGLYNIQPEDDHYEHHYSVRKLPSIDEFGNECIGIAKLLRSVIREYLELHRHPEVNDVLEYVFGQSAIGEFPSDRTMCFFVELLEAFEPSFIRSLQSEVLSEFPLWRLIAQFGEKKIGVYLTGAWVGDNWVAGEFTSDNAAYSAWLNDAKQYDEARHGPQSRQLKHVRALIPQSLNAVAKGGIEMLAVFDCFNAPYQSSHIAYFLQCKHPDVLYLDCGSAPLCKYAVGDRAEIFPQFCQRFWPNTDVEPPFWLTAYLIPPAERHELVVKGSKRTKPRVFEVESIVRDADLKVDQAK